MSGEAALERSDKVGLFGYEVVGGGLQRLCDVARVSVEEKDRRVYLVALNAEKVAMSKKLPELDTAIKQGIPYPDGMPITWAARLLQGATLERVTGTDIMLRLCENAAERGWGVYLLGGRRAVNSGAREVLERTYPELRVVGSRDGYFDEKESAAVTRDIRQSGAKLLFVALGSPKQELWLAEHFEACGVSFAMGVGGSFDVVAGEKPRAPEAMQRVGLEWAYRVAHEPGRLRRIVPRFASFLMSLGQEALERMGRGPGDEREDRD